MEIRNFAFMNDLEFKWVKFLKDELEPFYFPQSTQNMSKVIRSESLFDAATLQDWI